MGAPYNHNAAEGDLVAVLVMIILVAFCARQWGHPRVFTACVLLAHAGAAALLGVRFYLRRRR